MKKQTVTEFKQDYFKDLVEDYLARKGLEGDFKEFVREEAENMHNAMVDRNTRFKG